MSETYNYECINLYNGTRTPTGTVEYDFTTAYFFRNLYQRALSVINFNLPAEWNKNYFKNVLFGEGYIAIINTAQYGIIPQICNISGHGLYLQPTNILVAQPLVNFQGEIGRDCELIRLTPDYMGILDVVEHYALELSKCYTSINVSLVNSRISQISYPKNKAMAEALKVVAEKISSGESFIFADDAIKSNDLGENGEPLFTTVLDPARNYITDRLLDDFNSILNSFDREIGIPVIDDKRERMLESEVTTLISDAGTRLDTWTECLNETIGNTLKLFPQIDISFTTRLEESEVIQNDEANTDRAL